MSCREDDKVSFWEKTTNVALLEIQRFRTGITAKLLLVGLVLLLSQIPVAMISSLTRGRERLARTVEVDISAKWGGRQYVTGPVLTIPLKRETESRQKDGTLRKVEEISAFHAVPDQLAVSGELFPELRYRGIYEVVLYRSRLVLKGYFSVQDPLPAQWHPDYGEARIALGLSDIKGITGIDVKIDGRSRKVLPGTGNCSLSPHGVSVEIGPIVKKQLQQNIPFEITLSLNGCRDLFFWPVGRSTRAELSSKLSTPSFCGAFLPQEREVTETGFRAAWAVSEFNRNCPSSWVGSRICLGNESAFGVSLIKQASSYALVKRAVSYDILVYLIVLMTFLIAERVAKAWVHPLQYFVAGLSLVLFYSILLALSEHIPFNLAFFAATLVTAALNCFYGFLIFRKGAVAYLLAGVTAVAYALVFVILRLEDYALLAGSGVLLVIMIVLMAFTGRLNREDA